MAVSVVLTLRLVRHNTQALRVPPGRLIYAWWIALSWAGCEAMLNALGAQRWKLIEASQNYGAMFFITE